MVLTFVLEVVLVKLMLANGFDVDADGATLFCEELPFFFDRKMLALRSNIVGSVVGSLIDSAAFSKSLSLLFASAPSDDDAGGCDGDGASSSRTSISDFWRWRWASHFFCAAWIR